MTSVSCRAEGSRFDILQNAEQVRSNLSADVPSLGKFFSFPSSCARKIFFGLDPRLVKLSGEIRTRSLD